MITKLQKFLFCISALLLFVFNAPKLLGTGALNLGLLLALKEIGLEESFQENLLWGAGLRTIPLENERSISNYTDMLTGWNLSEHFEDCSYCLKTKNILLWPVDNAPFPFTALRVLGRISLYEGYNEYALKFLHQSVKLDEMNEQNPLIWLEIGDIYDRMEEPSLAIAAYKRAEYLGRVEQAGVQYLKKALTLEEQGDPMSAAEVLDQSLKLLPNNLCLLDSRHRMAVKNADDIGLIEELENKLIYFELEAINPRSDSRLRNCDVETMARFVSEGIWDWETLNRIVSYRVWQHPIAETDEFLNELIRLFPNEIDLLFYQGELYQRMQAWEKAREKYEQVIRLDSSYAKAYLRLADVLQVSCGDTLTGCEFLNEIEANYDHYLALVPDDLLGLKNRGEFFENTNNSQSGGWNEELARRTDDLQFVAELLDIPADKITLSSNLLENGGFEVWLQDRPEYWWQWDSTGIEGVNNALFFAGPDEIDVFEGSQSGRMQAIWLQDFPNLKPPQVVFDHNDEITGKRSQFRLKPNSIYLFRFYYQTEGMSGKIMSGPWFASEPDFPFVGTIGLQNTNGQWRKIMALDTTSPMGESTIRLAYRLLEVGNIEWDGIALREVVIDPAINLSHIPTGMWDSSLNDH